MKETFVEVALPLPLRGPLVYRLPASWKDHLPIGFRVKVPLGSRRLIGCVVGECEKRPSFPTKEILSVLDDHPLLSPHELRLLKWASAYYLTPIGEVLRHLLPPRLLTKAHLFRSLEKISSPLRGEDEGGGEGRISDDHLNPAQKEAARIIRDEMEKPDAQPILLHGITGSGKTEVYIEAVRHVLGQGGQALVLVPEIGLTPQLLERFRTGIGSTSSAYHSSLTVAERCRIWKGAREGKIAVAIATRSGIFLRFPNLRLIIIDEEHDPSFKQEERFCYHARDLALWRGREEKIPVLLGSATPSLESLHNVSLGRMQLVRLPERPAGATLPVVEMIDRRRRGTEKEPILSAELLEALRANLKRGEQSLLFLNRRGFSPFVLCPQCGFVPRCDRCDISLTLHGPSILVCHYCDRTEPLPSLCRQCQKGRPIPFGFGTERLDLELRRLFPTARIARLDRDTTRGKGWLTVLERMKKKEIDILVGTQMVTKGHDYPLLTLVGIVDADVALHLPDFRAAERTFQLITQVSGRAGRGERRGRVLIQTFHPEHEGLVAAANDDGTRFYSKELEERQEAGYPPFRRLIEIRLAGAKRDSVIEKSRVLARKIRAAIPPREGVLLGPAPCPVEKVRGKSRWRLLVKTPQYTKIQPRLARLLDDFAGNCLPSRMRMRVNVDPMEMM